MISLSSHARLPRSFFERYTVDVAHDLLGTYIVHESNGEFCVSMIVETEAYSGKDDPASHAYRGKTARNHAMFGLVGCSYVYFIYGNHFCFNIVARDSHQEAGAILIRAVEPVVGIEIMYKRRDVFQNKNISNGPGKLTQALAINRSHNGLDLVNHENLYLVSGRLVRTHEIIASTRIGIRVGQDKPWRFYVKK